MKDAKGHGSNKRGFDGDKRFGNSALEGHGVNSPAMMEARARQKAIAYGDSRQTPNATPLDVIRASKDYEAARELARGNPKADAAPVHGGTGGGSFFGRSASGAKAANKEAQDFQRTRATSGPHYLGANSRPQSAINRIKQPADVIGRPWKGKP